MSLTSRLRAVFLLVVLEFGALMGVPMPPEKIRALMDAINRQKLAHTRPSEQEDDLASSREQWLDHSDFSKLCRVRPSAKPALLRP